MMDGLRSFEICRFRLGLAVHKSALLLSGHNRV
jgi:hypothetical protein